VPQAAGRVLRLSQCVGNVRPSLCRDDPPEFQRFTTYLLDAARIAVVPGIEFGNDEHVRISYATSLENTEKGMDRMAEAVKQPG